MTSAKTSTVPTPRRLLATILNQERVSSSMWRLAVACEAPTSFLPGQFCMINLEGAGRLPLSRPLSIMHVDGDRLELLYKPVGGGTRALAAAPVGAAVRLLTPLGNPFPKRTGADPVLILAGGVGLPPLWSWRLAYGTAADLCCFGGRDGGDVPWSLLADGWRISVDRHEGLPDGHEALTGTVIDLALTELSRDAPRHHVLACGPLPLLRAASELAARRGWPCHVSVEERMGCGYGVCRGCVVPTADGGWWTSCREGPVIAAEALDWERLGLSASVALQAYDPPCVCNDREHTS